MDAAEVLRVLEVFERAGIRYGLTGGWGIDALIGTQRRPHRDIDLGIPTEQVEAAIAVLGPLGYRLALDQRPARLELEAPAGRVDLHPIRFDATGAGVQQGFGGAVYEYPVGSLEAVGWIAGVRVRCATPDLQRRFHEGYELTDRDRDDLAALASVPRE
jgi:lincosamide nucleotidyltransferase A/C/D/E